MSNIDPAVAAVLDRKNTDSDDEDALIAALEEEDDDPAFAALREQRLEQLHSEFSRAKQLRRTEHGTYREVKEEKQVLDITTSTKLCVVHFFKDGFARCGIMDYHLESLAPKHFDTRFLRVSVDNAPFLVTKLNVRVLPCVIAFVDGIGVDRIIGFEGLGHGTDKFTTKDLESRLLKAGVLTRAKWTGDEETRKREVTEEEVDDDDWD